MGYKYAFVQRGVVLDVEARTINDTDIYPIGKYYHGDLLPFFVEIRPGDNAPIDKEVKKGWVFLDNQFSEPEPFSINPENGEMYLPPSISAATFWATYQENIQLRNQLASINDVVNSMLIDQLTAEGAIV